MYTTNMSRSVFITQHNLNSMFMQNKKTDFIKYTVMIRNISMSDCRSSLFEARSKLFSFIESGSFLINIKKLFPTIPNTLKEQSESVLRVWTRQCEYVLAHRLRRGQQMFCLYSKIWEERALRDLMNRLRQQFTKHSKELIFSAVGVANLYNWEENRIPVTAFTKPNVLKDLDYIKTLFNETLVCKCCNHRILVDSKLPNIEYCHCRDVSKCPRQPYEGWMPFIDREDLLVWRKQDPTGPFQYKMYGKYNDVTAIDFLNVQIDIKYRGAWDKSAVNLEIIDIDPDKNSNSDLVYWEMEWPRFFSNRDYVFKRRYHIDCENNLLFMMSISTKHPNFPEKKDKFRIKDYWSIMVIKPLNRNFNEKGIEFTLTYFDNPGISIPQSVNTWVSLRAMPDFLTQLRKATKKYNKFREKHGHQCPCTIDELVRQYKEQQHHKVGLEKKTRKTSKGNVKETSKRRSKAQSDMDLLNKIFNLNDDSPNLMDFDAYEEDTENSKEIKDDNNSSDMNNSEKDVNKPPATTDFDEVILSTSPTCIENESKSFFRYFHPYYYFS